MQYSLFSFSTRLFIIAVAASCLCFSARGDSTIWGDRGTFPHKAVMLILESESREYNLRFGESVGNEAFEERAVKELKGELTTLMTAQRGERVTARLAVLRVANGSLLVCPDVSWGWPTQAFGDVVPEDTYEDEAEKCNAVMLKLAGHKGEGFAFKVGSEVPEEFAKQAVWNDKVLVEFNVDSVQRTRRPRKMISSYDAAFYDPNAKEEKDDSYRPYFEVRISDLKFIKGIPPAEGPRERPRFWPTAGTLPAIYQEMMNQIGVVGEWQDVQDRLQSFSDYVGRYQPRGVAIAKVGVVTANNVVLQSELDFGDFPVMAHLTMDRSELRAQAEAQNSERRERRSIDRSELEGGLELKVPVSAIGQARALKLKTGDRLLIAFRVTALNSEIDRRLDGQVQSVMHVQATDVQVGTDEQLQAYMPEPPQPAPALAGSPEEQDSELTSYVAPVTQKGTMHASDNPAEEGGFDEASASVWGDPGSFPQLVRVLLRERDKGIAGIPGDPAFGDESEEPQERLIKLAKTVEGRRVRARLSVMQVTPNEVYLLPDVTWGFPILSPEEVSGDFEQHHSVIRLQAAGTAEQTERIALTIGKHIKAEEAAKLAWNDKVIVDFRADAISFAPPAKSDDVSGGYGRSDRYAEQMGRMQEVTSPPDDTPVTLCTVQISGVRVSSVPHADLLVSLRTELWPGPGTLPFMLNLADGGSGFEAISERSPYTDYASRSTFQGSAVFELEDIRGDDVRFNAQPLISMTSHAGLVLSDEHQIYDGMLSVPIGAFPLEDRHRIGRQGTRHLLHFEARVIDGSGPVMNPNWDHQVIQLSNVRPGTPAQLKEAERLLPSMEKNAEQFRAAWERDNADRRQALLAAIAKAKQERENAQASLLGTFEHEPESAVAPRQIEETQSEEKSPEPEGWSFRRADWLSRVWPALGALIGWEVIAAAVLGVCVILAKARTSLSDA